MREIQNQKESENLSNSEKTNETTSEFKKSKHFILNKKTIKMLIITGGIFIVGGFTFTTLNNPLFRLNHAVKEKNTDKIVEIYEEFIDGDTRLETKTKEMFLSDLTSIKNNFLNGTLSFEEAINQLEVYKEIDILETNLKNTKNSIIEINDSRTAFATANEALKIGAIASAIEHFNKVVSSDEENYKIAQEQISTSKETYINETLTTVKKLIKEKEYNTAITQLEKALKIFPKESSLITQKTEAQTLLEKQKEQEEIEKIEKLKKNQKLTVSKAYTEDSFIYDQAFVIVKNNTNQVVKNYKVGILMFDKNGYPVNKQYGSTNLEGGQADTPNIQPGATYGWNSYWYVESGADKIKACVMEAEFYDGTTWENPYFEYWYETEKDRY